MFFLGSIVNGLLVNRDTSKKSQGGTRKAQADQFVRISDFTHKKQ